MCDANSNQCQKVVKTATFKCEEGKKINHYFRCCWQPQGNFHFDLPFLEKSDEAQSDWNVKSPLRQFRYCLNINFSTSSSCCCFHSDKTLFSSFFTNQWKKREGGSEIWQDLKRQFAILIRMLGWEIFDVMACCVELRKCFKQFKINFPFLIWCWSTNVNRSLIYSQYFKSFRSFHPHVQILAHAHYHKLLLLSAAAIIKTSLSSYVTNLNWFFSFNLQLIIKFSLMFFWFYQSMLCA